MAEGTLCSPPAPLVGEEEPAGLLLLDEVLLTSLILSVGALDLLRLCLGLLLRVNQLLQLRQEVLTIHPDRCVGRDGTHLQLRLRQVDLEVQIPVPFQHLPRQPVKASVHHRGIRERNSNLLRASFPPHVTAAWMLVASPGCSRLRRIPARSAMPPG